MNEIARISPLENAAPLLGAPFSQDGLGIRERAFLNKVVVKGNCLDPNPQKAITEVLGAGLPLTPNTALEAESQTVLWLGPEEWLVVSDPTTHPDTMDRLVHNLNDGRSLAVDVSDQRTVIEVSGEKARELLSKGTSIDLRSTIFGPGQCRQTVFATAFSILHCKEAAKFDFYIDQTFAEYVLAWLISTAAPSSGNLHRWDREQ